MIGVLSYAQYISCMIESRLFKSTLEIKIQSISFKLRQYSFIVHLAIHANFVKIIKV